MSNFKPQASFITDKGLNQFYGGHRRNRCDINVYPTYTKLKKNMINMLNDSCDESVTVTRSKRGQFGEYYEHWTLINGEPTIIKQGWN